LPEHAVACSVFVHGGVPQTFGVPAPPQIVLPVHADVPQSRTPPQPSAIFPHWFAPQVVSGEHAAPSGPRSEPPPQTLSVPPPPQISGNVHEPQLAATPASSTVVPPQPSGWGPHFPV
jgi:hypothetical protein